VRVADTDNLGVRWWSRGSRLRSASGFRPEIVGPDGRLPGTNWHSAFRRTPPGAVRGILHPACRRVGAPGEGWRRRGSTCCGRDSPPVRDRAEAELGATICVACSTPPTPTPAGRGWPLQEWSSAFGAIGPLNQDGAGDYLSGRRGLGGHEHKSRDSNSRRSELSPYRGFLPRPARCLGLQRPNGRAAAVPSAKP